jgi:hypothetical protein
MQRNANYSEVFKLTVDDYDLIYKNGFLDHILCQTYIKGMDDVLSEGYIEKKIKIERFDYHVKSVTEYDTIEEYFKDESLENKYIDMEFLINKNENRTLEYQHNEVFPDLFETIGNALNPTL